MDKQAVNLNDLLTARPTFAAAWDKRGAWRCHQCAELLAFVSKNSEGKRELKTVSYFQQDGVWFYPSTGFAHLENAEGRRREKRARAAEMKAQGESAEAIQREMEGMDWMFESAAAPRPGWKAKTDGSLEPEKPSSFSGWVDTPPLAAITLPASVSCV